MATINKRPVPSVRTHEGAPAVPISDAVKQLERSVMSCLLWEDQFYEDGEAIADRVARLTTQCDPQAAFDIAVRARTKMNLRHVPLLIASSMLNAPAHKALVGRLLPQIILRADELTEFLSIYWKSGRRPLAAQVKVGLARAFVRFSAYDLAKYNRENAVKLRDVLFLCHAKPKDDEQDAIWKRLVDGTLESPDTWEVALSGGADKKATWERLLAEKKLGGMALIRNLRNMQEAGLGIGVVESAMAEADFSRVLPFRFFSAAAECPMFERALDAALLRSVRVDSKIPAVTILVDVSGSMDAAISGKTKTNRIDSACALAAILVEMSDRARVFSFSNEVCEIPGRRGMSLRDAIKSSQTHGVTALGQAVAKMPKDGSVLVVITDEQSQDVVGPPPGIGYMLNVASYERSVGFGAWRRISGFSSALVEYIRADLGMGVPIEDQAQ